MIRLSINDLAVGQPTRWPIHDRSGTLLFKAGAVISNEHQMQLLLARGFYKPVEDRAASARAEPVRAAEPAAKPSVFALVGVLAGALTDLHRELDSILQEYREGIPKRLGDVATKLELLCRNDVDATLAALYYGSSDGGIAERHLHVGVLAMLLADVAGLDARARHVLTCAAITYDVGFGGQQSQLNDQKTALTADQRDDIRRHPLHGARLLEHAGVADPQWLDAVLQHHERIDGSGYPSQTVGEAICAGARILGLADIYTAMIRPRGYREAVHSRAALRSLFLERGKLVDERMAALLVKEIGVFPPGTLVRLKSLELAAIFRRGKDAAHPQLMCLVGRDGMPLSRASSRDPHDPACAIVETVNLADFKSVHGLMSTLWLR